MVMKFDAFAILVLLVIGFMVVFSTLLAIWYWKFGRKLIHQKD